MTTIEKDAEMLDSVLGKLLKNGFEWRGGDTFPRETVSLYVNETLDEFVMLRYNRADDRGSKQPPLIHRGAMAELDRPMNDMESLRFVTIPEFLGLPAPREEKAIPAPALSKAAQSFRPPAP